MAHGKKITWVCLLAAIAAAGCRRAEPGNAQAAISANSSPPPVAPCCAPATQPETRPAGTTASPAAAPESPAATASATASGAISGAAPGTGSRAGEWIEPAKRFKFNLDFRVTDQTGRQGRLSQYLGKPIAVSFIFTRCTNPQMCPLITTVTGFLQRDLAKAGLAGKVRLLLISYDPAYDTPDRLKQYALDRGIEFDDGLVAMLRPNPDDYPGLMNELSVDVGGTPDGQINHRAELILIDKQGRFVRDYQGRVWDPAPVAVDLQRLAGENF